MKQQKCNKTMEIGGLEDARHDDHWSKKSIFERSF